MTIQIEELKIEELKNFENNPRLMEKSELEKLKKSITKFGLIDPLIVDENNVVMGGNQRLVAAKELEMVTVPCVRVKGLTEPAKKSLNIALNRIMGDWDEQKLYQILSEIKESEQEMLEYSGFSEHEVENLLKASAGFIPQDLDYDGPIGTQDGMRFATIFYFDTVEEKDKVEKYFKPEKGNEPDSKKLLELING